MRRVKRTRWESPRCTPCASSHRVSVKHSVNSAWGYSPSGRAPLRHAEQIDVEHQRGARRDVAAGAARAIAQVRRNDQRALAADMHGGEAFVPALDDLALAEREGKRIAPVERAVELFALLAIDEQPSGVIDRHGLAGLRHGSGPRLDVDDAQAAGRGDLAGGKGGTGSKGACGERQ